MREPALNDLISKASNKYSLVLATAKRARELVDGDEPLVKILIDNPVSIATDEIAQDMIHCVYPDPKEEEDASEEVDSLEATVHEEAVGFFDSDETENSDVFSE